MHSQPKVVHCKKEPYDVLIDRTTKWGNPFIIGVHGSRGQVIRMYEHYILHNVTLRDKLPELRGKILGCWCAPEACHGDVLLKLANVNTLLFE